MTEAVTDSVPSARVGRDRIDTILNATIAILLVGLLAFGSYFALNVWTTRRAEYLARPTARAVENVKAKVRANPNDPNLRVSLGMALGADGQFSAAVEQFNNALTLNEELVGAYRGLGLVAYLQKDYDAATNYLLKIVELTESSEYQDVNNSREEALFTLGIIAIEQKNYEDAVGYLKGALRIRRADSDTYYQLARAYRGLGEVDAALEQLDNALAFLNGNFPEALFLVGELYMEKGDEVNASAAYAQAARLAPDADPPQERLAQFGTAAERLQRSRDALDNGDIEMALNEAIIADNLEPENAEILKHYASVLVVRKNDKAALAIYKRVLVLTPDDTEVQDAIKSLEDKLKKAKKKQ